MAHGIAETWLRTGKRPEDLIGSFVEQEGFEIDITEEMIEHIEKYVEYVLDIKSTMPHTEIAFEQRVELTEVNTVLFGTADTVIVQPFRHIHIFDLKFGQGKRVSAWQNKQLMYYALGIALKEDCEAFTIHICQPRVEDGFTQYSGTMAELKEFEKELKCKAELALFKDAPLVPGEWCKASFCPNRVQCKALSGLAKELVVKDFDEPIAVDKLTMEQIIKVLKYEDTIKDWMVKVNEHAKELMLQGCEIPGYKVVKSLGNAKWVDPEIVVAEFGDEFGERIYKPVVKEVLSPAQFEKMAGKKRLGKNFREEYTMRPETGFKIVEADEKGENVKLTKAEEDFK